MAFLLTATFESYPLGCAVSAGRRTLEWWETSEPGASGEMPSGSVALSPVSRTASTVPPEPLFLPCLVPGDFAEGIAPNLQPSGWLASSAHRRSGRRWDGQRRTGVALAMALLSDLSLGRRVTVTGGSPRDSPSSQVPFDAAPTALLESSSAARFQSVSCGGAGRSTWGGAAPRAEGGSGL